MSSNRVFNNLLRDLIGASTEDAQAALEKHAANFVVDDLSSADCDRLIAALEAADVQVPKGKAWKPSTRVRRLLNGVVPREQPQAASPHSHTPSPANLLELVSGVSTREGLRPASSRPLSDFPPGPRTSAGPGAVSSRSDLGPNRERADDIDEDVEPQPDVPQVLSESQHVLSHLAPSYATRVANSAQPHLQPLLSVSMAPSAPAAVGPSSLLGSYPMAPVPSHVSPAGPAPGSNPYLPLGPPQVQPLSSPAQPPAAQGMLRHQWGPQSSGFGMGQQPQWWAPAVATQAQGQYPSSMPWSFPNPPCPSAPRPGTLMPPGYPAGSGQGPVVDHGAFAYGFPSMGGGGHPAGLDSAGLPYVPSYQPPFVNLQSLFPRRLRVVVPRGARRAFDNILHNSLSASAFVAQREWRSPDFQSEAKIMARTIDLMVDQFGPDALDLVDAMETVVRHLMALVEADRSGNMEAASMLEEQPPVTCLVPEDLFRHSDSLLRYTQRSRQVARGGNQQPQDQQNRRNRRRSRSPVRHQGPRRHQDQRQQPQNQDRRRD